MVQIPFKYHPNVWELGVFKHSRSKKNPPKCECCGTPTEYYLNYIYADEEPCKSMETSKWIFPVDKVGTRTYTSLK